MIYVQDNEFQRTFIYPENKDIAKKFLDRLQEVKEARKAFSINQYDTSLCYVTDVRVDAMQTFIEVTLTMLRPINNDNLVPVNTLFQVQHPIEALRLK